VEEMWIVGGLNTVLGLIEALEGGDLLGRNVFEGGWGGD
jgi:hypothetical protein